MELTSEQTKVVESPINSRILVEAVPGSGKTEVLAWRISKLLESGVNVGEIMFGGRERCRRQCKGANVQRWKSGGKRTGGNGMRRG